MTALLDHLAYHAERNRLRRSVGTDAGAFLEALASGARAEAARCCGGELLQGFRLDGAPEFESWLEHERRTLERRWREAAFEHAAELEGGHDQAAALLATRVDADPFDEEALRRRLRNLGLAGRQRRARDDFDAFARGR